MNSLRTQLSLFGALLIALCIALGVVMATLYRSSAGAQVDTARNATQQSCNAIAARYAQSVSAAPLSPPTFAPQLDLLQVLLQLVLREAPHVEGGIWQRQQGLLAYAYPSYEGSGIKRDVPSAEQPLIVDIAQRATRTQQIQVDVVRGSREALVAAACPLIGRNQDLAAWTMTRTHVGALAAQRSLYIGFAMLLALVMVSAAWLRWILRRGLRHVARLETQLLHAQDDEVPELDRTGLRELDRIVDSFNHYRERYALASKQLQQAVQQRNRDQRLAALGRMTGSIAHEIRNPIAAMRLKAENALAAEPERYGQALHTIVNQIDRLDGLVQSLLALVQPLSLSPSCVALNAWLEERLASASQAAALRNVALTLRNEGTAATLRLDPIHMARAMDNLLDNALHHAPSGSPVRLSAQRTPANTLLLSVEDDGPGVPTSLQPRLFEPFATGRADGTGLGLALAREVALAHGGELRYVARGAGACFELEIPWQDC